MDRRNCIPTRAESISAIEIRQAGRQAGAGMIPAPAWAGLVSVRRYRLEHEPAPTAWAGLVSV